MPSADGGSPRPFGERKTRDRAFVLPVVGIFVLLPPIANIFLIDARLFGIPVTVIYLFVAWGALIAGAAWLAPRLRAADNIPRSADPEPTSGLQSDAKFDGSG